MNKRKTIGIVAALLLAVISTFALVKFVQGAEQRATAGEELVDVLVATTDIKAGTPSGDLADSVAVKQVQVKVRPKDAVTSFPQIDGLVTAIDLVAGEQLLSTRFVNPASFQSARNLSVGLPTGANEVTFKLAPERALGGQLRPGDMVTVVASFEPFDNEKLDAEGNVQQLPKSPSTSHVILNGVPVVRVQFPDNANTSTKEKDGVGLAPSADVFVTLAIDQPSLERAIFAAEHGEVWLSFEPTDAIRAQNKVVTRGNVYEPTPSLLGPPLVGAPTTTPAAGAADNAKAS